MNEKDVLYEDNHLIIVNKRSGEIVQVDDTKDIPLIDKVKAFLKKKHNKQGNVFLETVHRLDRPVSGAIIFAKTSKALPRLNKMFQDKKVQKTYWALTLRHPPQKFALLQDYLLKDRSRNVTKAYKKQVKEAKFSELEYTFLKDVKGKSLLEINPLTGRPHQIRVQLASIGCIIKGDLKYGAPEPNPDKSICLHSRHVSFIHPVSKEKISVTAPIHHDNLWQ